MLTGDKGCTGCVCVCVYVAGLLEHVCGEAWTDRLMQLHKREGCQRIPTSASPLWRAPEWRVVIMKL